MLRLVATDLIDMATIKHKIGVVLAIAAALAAIPLAVIFYRYIIWTL